MQKTDDNKTDIVINISGGNNQILPNATHAVQNFYGKELNEADTAQREITASDPEPEQGGLSQLIVNKDRLDYYTHAMSHCLNARQLGLVVVDMVNDNDVKLNKDDMVKQRFINVIRPYAPQVTTSVVNIRKYINQAWEDHIRQQRVSGHSR